jgi:hypothetical protein
MDPVSAVPAGRWASGCGLLNMFTGKRSSAARKHPWLYVFVVIFWALLAGFGIALDLRSKPLNPLGCAAHLCFVLVAVLYGYALVRAIREEPHDAGPTSPRTPTKVLRLDE